MNLIIERLNGAIYNTSDYDIKVLDFRVSSPSPRTVTEVIEGRDGHIDLGTTYEGREITAEFFVTSADGLDFPLLRNEIFRIFRSRESFYIIDSREPGKRWRVKCNEAFNVQQLRSTRGNFEITFVSDSAYAESIGTTLNPLTLDAETWQIGQGLIAEGLKYRHTTSSFAIFNAGDVLINPRYLPLEIAYKGASTNLTIKNVTTGDEWVYGGNTVSNDIVTLRGVRSLKNGLSIFANTNRRLLTLGEGWNEFMLTGTSGSFEITFDFRFYTL